jgi:hypothetical protein
LSELEAADAGSAESVHRFGCKPERPFAFGGGKAPAAVYAQGDFERFLPLEGDTDFRPGSNRRCRCGRNVPTDFLPRLEWCSRYRGRNHRLIEEELELVSGQHLHALLKGRGDGEIDHLAILIWSIPGGVGSHGVVATDVRPAGIAAAGLDTVREEPAEGAHVVRV